MEFDYIIVAAGTAGCVLANRLTANGRFSVASGVIASPQLLMVSGICSPRKLAPGGISPIHELGGVGEDLQDHLQARPVFAARCQL